MKKFLVPFLALLCIASCKINSDSSNQDPVSQKLKIVVIGSSTAEGAGASVPDSSWVGRYRQYLKSINPENEVVNLAKGGYTTYHLMSDSFITPAERPAVDFDKNITAALAENPDGIILNLPSNDAARDWEPAEQVSNFDKITQPALQRKIPIWICTTQPRNFDNPTQIQTQLKVRDSIHAKYGTMVLDFWTGAANEKGWIRESVDSGDGIHLNDAGHRLLFEIVKAKVNAQVFTN